MSRPPRLVRTAAAGALVLLMAASPSLPSSAASPAATPSAPSLAKATAGPGTVTAGMQSEINAVIAQGRTSARRVVMSRPASLVQAQVRCATFEGQRYCLNSGWTTQTPQQLVSKLTASAGTLARRPVPKASSTGDEDLLTTLKRRAALPQKTREAAERRELTDAARAVAKVWLLRNQIEGVPLPAGFLKRHPEVRLGTSARTAAGAPTMKSASAYPQKSTVIPQVRVAEQTRTYWCGPTAMQMIAWGWEAKNRGQAYWASKLGTTSSGTAITEMVRVTNRYTGWDRSDKAGTYITLDISKYSYAKWMLLNIRHIAAYRAPLIHHPILLKRYFPYLDDDASGHFQVGRGYDQRGSQADLVNYFEPWNQQRFDPSEPRINRVQSRSAYKSYRANLAHFQHNIGV